MSKKKTEKKNLSDKQPKLSNKEYEAEITKLHAELIKLQYWVFLRIVFFGSRHLDWAAPKT